MKVYGKTLSIIVPCYNEEESVPLFYAETKKQEAFFHEKDIELEFVFVDDGSKDRTVEAVKKLHEQDGRVHLVSFSRNFGKEAAIIAGLEKASGDFTVLMDADLQDPPAILPEMYGYIEQGYDSVATRRVDRKGEPPIRSFFARRFYGLMRKISKTEIVDGARDYRLMTRQMVNSILELKEYNRYSPSSLSSLPSTHAVMMLKSCAFSARYFSDNELDVVTVSICPPQYQLHAGL